MPLVQRLLCHLNIADPRLLALGVLLWPVVAGSQEPADGGCMECHSDPELTIMRNGKQVSLQVDEQILGHSTHQGFACADCHEGLDPDIFPHANPIPRVDCMSCHFDAADFHPFHPQMMELKAGQPLPAHSDCTSCHGTHEVVAKSHEAFPFSSARQSKACSSCHKLESSQFNFSAHARSLALNGPEHAPDCLRCHSHPDLHVNGDTLAHKTSLLTVCGECHRDDPEVSGKTMFGTPFIVAFENSVHGQALLEGNADAPSCSDCHGSHGVDRSNRLDTPTNRFQVSATCAACHSEAAADLSESAHGMALARGISDAPVCTDCHGEHSIHAAGDPDSQLSAHNLAQQVCGDCHGSVKLAERYNLASNTFQTFNDSYHGLAGRSGAVEVVNCASCHGYHKVLNSSDERSLVHKDNMAATCGSCHPGANDRFAIGKVHVSLDRQSEEPILYWIATIYVWLIVIVIGGMVVHNALDYFHKVRRKAKAHWSEMPHQIHFRPQRMHLRMTLNERLQHGVLALSFVVLVITGFMLRYPEAWWVEGLRSLNEHLFEWRSITHRIAGVVMVFGAVWHFIYIVATPRGRSQFKAILPRIRDLLDAIGMVRYNVGLRAEKPPFGRFSYIEKAEYWAMLWGSFLMVITGFFMWFDNFTMSVFTKLGFDVFRIIHFYEAVLATLAIIVWHFYFVIFNPDVYPMNMAWLTGKMSEEEMLHDHPLELQEAKDKLTERDNPVDQEG